MEATSESSPITSSSLSERKLSQIAPSVISVCINFRLCFYMLLFVWWNLKNY